jgi:hypothetical protein
MMFIKIKASFIDSKNKPQRVVYAVALPVKTFGEAMSAVNEAVPFSMKGNGNKLTKLEAMETDIYTYMKLAC